MKTLHTVLMPVFLCGIVLSVYGVATTYGLCPFDDELYIIPRAPFTDVSQSIWMPLTYMSYSLDRVIGWGIGGMHLQSIVWHAGGTVLFYFLLFRLFKTRLAAFLAALFWSIHPLRVESVVWIASRKDVISTFFLLASLIAWIGDGKEGIRKCPYVSLVLLAIGALAKPSVMLFPLFAAAFDYFFTKQRHSLHCWACVIVLSLTIAAEGGLIQGVGATEFSGLIPLWYKVINAFASMSIYVHHTLWPERLAVQCFMRYPLPPRFSLVGILICIAAALWLINAGLRAVKAKKWDLITREHAGIALFFLSFAPFLGISGFGYHSFADRFTIIPALGLSLASAAIVSRWLAEKQRLALTISVFIVGALAFASFFQTRYWRDTKTLISHTLQVDGDTNVSAHRVLGADAWEDRDMENTYRHLKAAYDVAWNEPIRNHLLLRGHWLIEACYETGRRAEGEDFYFIMKKWNGLLTEGNGMHPSFAAADILWDAYSGVPKRCEDARKNFARFEYELPNEPITNALGYRLAMLRNDKEAAFRYLKACANEPELPNGRNRKWAQRILAEQKVDHP